MDDDQAERVEDPEPYCRGDHPGHPVGQRAERVPLTPLRQMPAAQGPDAETAGIYPPEPDRPPAIQWQLDSEVAPSRPVWPLVGMVVALSMMALATALVVLSAISGVPWAIVMAVAGWVVGVVADPRRHRPAP